MPFAPAAAVDPTGTGGQFVPLQARLVDTRTGVGGFTGPLTANVYQSFTVNGAVGIPSTGVAALVATVTVINSNPSTGGTIQTAANSGGTAPPVSAVLFEANETLSNTVVIEDGTDGKIKLSSTVGVQVLVDVQGYISPPEMGTPLRAGSSRCRPRTSPRSTPRPPARPPCPVRRVAGVPGDPSDDRCGIAAIATGGLWPAQRRSPATMQL